VRSNHLRAKILITGRNGDIASYIIAAIKDDFDVNMLQSFDGDSYSTQEKSHGRKETRLALVNNDLSVLGDLEYEWPELKTMGIVSSFRVDKEIGTEKSFSVRYYISSKVLDAETLLNSTRSHWGVEVCIGH
jgi:predicted transposase YbfD/YdcC